MTHSLLRMLPFDSSGARCSALGGLVALLLLALAGCSDSPSAGGQTGTELTCTTDQECVDALGVHYACGASGFCLDVRTGDGSITVPDGGACVDPDCMDGAARDGDALDHDGGASDSDGGTSSGDGGGADTCRARDECSGSGPMGLPLECQGPNAGQVCGIPPREGCASRDDCGGGECHAVADSCSPDGVGSECRPACTVEDNCGDGFRCGDGACEAIRCDEGFTCPSHMRCDPTSLDSATAVHQRHHGCVIVQCTTDNECDDDEFCVVGYCQTGLGACVEPMLVP